MVGEIDFPRGGVSNLRTNGVAIKRNRKPSGGHKQTNKKPNLKDDIKSSEENDRMRDVFKGVLSLELFTPGLRCLGFVKKISETQLTLECSDGIVMFVPINRISKKFSEFFSARKCEATLDEMYFPGQALAFKVIEVIKAGHSRSKPDIVISSCPYAVNSHLVPSSLLPGIVFNGAITSIEEKGAVVDFGLSEKFNVSGFVSLDDLPDYFSLNNLKLGQVLMFRVKEKPSEACRVVKLSAFVEAAYCEGQKFIPNHFMPGTVIMASPDKIVFDGVFVNLSNDITAFVRKMHLPPRIRYDLSKFIKPIRVCVMCCKQNSPVLILSGHPDIVSISHVEKRILSPSLKIGEKIDCYVYALDKQQNVYFRLENKSEGETNERNVQLVTAKALRINIDDIENNLANFSLNSLHSCKIIGYSMADRQLLVTTKETHLKSKSPIALEEMKVGERLQTIIRAIKPNGLTVQVGHGDLNGYITKMHVNDSPGRKDWQKEFTKGKKLICRMLYFDVERNRVFLTAKPSLVNESSERRISHISENLIGIQSTGVVLNVLSSGGLVVGFYNRVTGLLHATEAKHIDFVEVGSSIKVRVRSVNVSSGQMIVDPINLSDVKTEVNKEKAICKELSSGPITTSKSAKPFMIYSAKLVGPWTYGDTFSQTSAEIELPGGSVGRLHASELSENFLTTEGSFPMVEFIKRNAGKTVKVKVISVGSLKSVHSRARELLMKKHQTEKVFECTMNCEKIREPRKKLKLINYKTEFLCGDLVPAFLLPSKNLKSGMLNTLVAEINPFFKAHVLFSDEISGSKSAHVSENNDSSIIIDESSKAMIFEDGELRFARVIGVNKAKRSRIVQLSLLNKERIKKKKTAKTIMDFKEENEYDKKSGKKTLELKKDSISVEGSKLKFCKVSDPGLDWTVAGFRLAELVGVMNRGLDKRQMENDNYEPEDEVNELDEDSSNALKSLGMEPLESVKAFDQQLVHSQNSSRLWISYMAFFLCQQKWTQKKQYERAKLIAERALNSIDYKHKKELFNVWAAYLNLEVMLGSKESLNAVFQRACGAMDSFSVHKQLVKVYQNQSIMEEKYDDICNLFETMLKKFKQQADFEIWIMYAGYLMEQNELEKSRQLMQRALQCANKKKHIRILTQFAELEKRFGDIERSKTMFELIQSYRSKKTSKEST